MTANMHSYKDHTYVYFTKYTYTYTVPIVLQTKSYKIGLKVTVKINFRDIKARGGFICNIFLTYNN